MPLTDDRQNQNCWLLTNNSVINFNAAIKISLQTLLSSFVGISIRDVNKATRYKAKELGGKAKATGCKAKAKDLGFKAKAKNFDLKAKA